MIETLDRLLQQPTAIGWLLLFNAVTVVIVAVCSVLILGILKEAGRQLIQRASFFEQMQQVLDRGDLDMLITKCRERLLQFNDDAAAHYFLGVALHRKGDLRQSLVHLRRIPELQAGWDVRPMILSIEEKLASAGDRLDLKVVRATPDGPDHEA